ncbi:hypothetical protein [Pluralibacter gergoviae]|uniref:hypothetical protein n=1 Tax=Pluralibacter gergoviae TaxID=61647 RepID=UPI003890BFDA
MTDAELAHTKALAFWMTERVFMNPISAKFLTEDWRKAFPDEVAVAERMKALVEALEKAQQRIDSQREYYDGVIADGGKRIAELESRTVTVKPMRPGHITVGGEKIGIYMRDEVDEFIAALDAAGIKVEAE